LEQPARESAANRVATVIDNAHAKTFGARDRVKMRSGSHAMAATSHLALKRITFFVRPKRNADDQDERGGVWIGQFGTASAPRWSHFAHTMPPPSDLIGVSSGGWPTFKIVL
jgi:hypothetical protein